MKKLPKSMGACADLLHDVRTKRLALDKAAAEMKAEEERIKTHIIDNLDKRDETGAAGKRFRVQIKRKRKYRIKSEAWEDFLKWTVKNKAYDLLQRRTSDTALRDRAEQSRAKIPGLDPFDYVDVSLTKVS